MKLQAGFNMAAELLVQFTAWRLVGLQHQSDWLGSVKMLSICQTIFHRAAPMAVPWHAIVLLVMLCNKIQGLMPKKG